MCTRLFQAVHDAIKSSYAAHRASSPVEATRQPGPWATCPRHTSPCLELAPAPGCLKSAVGALGGHIRQIYPQNRWNGKKVVELFLYLPFLGCAALDGCTQRNKYGVGQISAADGHDTSNRQIPRSGVATRKAMSAMRAAPELPRVKRKVKTRATHDTTNAYHLVRFGRIVDHRRAPHSAANLS